jgi:hypothetical protein
MDLFFPNILFPSKCTPFLLKIGEDIPIDIYIFNHLNLVNFILKHIWTYLFQTNMFLIWKLWILKKCVFNKSYTLLCYLEHGYIIYKQYRPI